MIMRGMVYLMKKIIVIPDSFKGSMSSTLVTDILSSSIDKYMSTNVVKVPIADGGEGSVDCFLQIRKGKKIYTKVHSPDFKMINAYFGLLEDETAVIEIAESSGLTKQDQKHPVDSNTYGFGELIKKALDYHCKKIYLCLGGSATTDCACGMACALGAGFYDDSHNAFIPLGASLSKVKSIDITSLDSRIHETKFIVMSDVENPLHGKNGAAYIFGPQKGASKKEVQLLDEGLKHISKLLEDIYHIDPLTNGAGAAGGAGYGCLTFLNAEINSGIEGFLELVHFDDLVKDCDLIVTGEGCLDKQSLMGKVLSGLKKHAPDTKIVSFCGKCELSKDILEQNNIEMVEIANGINTIESINNGPFYLKKASDKYFGNLSLAEKSL